MNKPWNEIDIYDYEKHMSLSNVHQLQTMNQMMKEQFCAYPIQSVITLGIAGGNGLEHINAKIVDSVYGVNINEKYLNEVLHSTEETKLIEAMQEIGYQKKCQFESKLPNRKKLASVDFIS